MLLMKFARILIDRTEGTILDYSIPETWGNKVAVGGRVAVPLRNKEVLGTVLELSSTSSFPHVKTLSRLLISEEAPLLSPKLMKLAAWMSDYYLTPLHTVLRILLPGSIREAKKKRKRKHDLFSGETVLPVPAPTLNRDQEKVVRLLCEELEFLFGEQLSVKKSATSFLLHGVTGSGKTEVYLRSIERTLALGKSALVLVPEIALTPQTVERFRSRFETTMGTGLIAVLHSHLSEGERHEEWLRLHRGEARIAIGARSAVFAPLRELGLIIVDEEHEGSYKQEESPRYHARDVAVMRAHLEQCPIVLGSATPSMESFYNTQIGKYQLLELPVRADHQKMPLVRVLDLRLQARGKQADGVLSFPLRQAIAARLELGEQVILFLNRRGFASSLLCEQCGYVCECPHCSLALTFHRASNALICHLCGLTKKIPKTCPECRDPAILQRGMGTERVEAAIKQAFPTARLARMDTDTMKGKGIYEKTLNLFRSRQIDILIGTQMIAKGLDFPNVTLVGIINADTSLHAPDFRAGERTFQLLTQVAGRAGRGDRDGEVMIQTYTPVSPSIQFARHHDYHGFFEQEIVLRKQFGYPPFQRMILVQLRGKIQERTSFFAVALREELRKALPPKVEVGEAVPAPLERAHGQYRFHIALKGGSIKKMGVILLSVLEKSSFPKGVITTIDVDPQSLM
jgi:primosomal protein N' (replication factor Y)